VKVEVLSNLVLDFQLKTEGFKTNFSNKSADYQTIKSIEDRLVIIENEQSLMPSSAGGAGKITFT
jgi:hypothetical protein